jgi:hypothetical protein
MRSAVRFCVAPLHTFVVPIGVSHYVRDVASSWVRSSLVRIIRRAVVGLTLTSVMGLGIRLRGKGGTPPRTGGWKEVTPSDLR